MNDPRKLNREKADRFRHYRQKWRSMTRSTEPINQTQARIALNQFCAAFGLEPPTINFYPGVSSAYSEVRRTTQQNQSRDRVVARLRNPWVLLLSIYVSFGCASIIGLLISHQLKNWLRQYGLDQIYTTLEQITIEDGDGARTSLFDTIVWWGVLFSIIAISSVINVVRLNLLARRVVPKPANRVCFFPSNQSRLIQLIRTQLVEPIKQQLSPEVQTAVYQSLVAPHSSYDRLMQGWCDRFWQAQFRSSEPTVFFQELFQSERLCPVASYLDFCISELNCTVNSQQWQAVQTVLQTCGWIITLEDRWIVCDRPLQFNFDQNYQFHAEGKPAIEYADGFKFYAHHGVTLREAYGRCLPRDWKAQWLMTEHNAEIRRLLIQEIGYDRICQELEAIVIDSWREYTLVRCATASGYEPFVFLKMTCPSTHYVHVLPVPPEIESARAAIRWVNWGIDPEEFTIES